MISNLHSSYINSIDIKVFDLEESKTAIHVFQEFSNDQYGLENIDIKETDTVIDVGANIGIFSIYVKKKFNCKVISFEPVPDIFELFKKNIELNGLSLSDFQIHNKAITSEAGNVIKIGTPYDNSGGSSKFYKTNWKINECITETLDNYLNIRCKYLKIDCEGSEYEIIPSIIDKINNIENIGIEYHKIDNSPNNPVELHKLLKEKFKGKMYTNINFHV